MKFRCPYCRQDLGSQPIARCPQCDRAIYVPDHLRPVPFRLRKLARERRALDVRQEQRRRMHSVQGFNWGRKPSTILISVAILAVAGGILIGRAKTTGVSVRKTPQMLCLDELNIFRVALEDFRRDCGHYPDPKSGLMSLINNPGLPAWNGPYVTLIKRDPWRHRYVYEIAGDEPIVLSSGPDGLRGTPDDLKPDNWEAVFRTSGRQSSNGTREPSSAMRTR